MGGSERGFTTLELLTAAAIGLVLTGAALALLAAGNRLVASSLAQREAWRQVTAAASLWSTEWRGAGYDPTGAAGSAVTRLAADTMEFTADWNGDGELEPTSGNPNERLAWAAAPGTWKRGVNGGGRLPIARPEALDFSFLEGPGLDLGPSPPVDRARMAEARVRMAGGGSLPVDVVWTAARRNP